MLLMEIFEYHLSEGPIRQSEAQIHCTSRRSVHIVCAFRGFAEIMVKMKAIINAVQRILFTSTVIIRKTEWINNFSGLFIK